MGILRNTGCHLDCAAYAIMGGVDMCRSYGTWCMDDLEAVMLAKRVIPSMLVRGRTLVKGERYNSWRSIGHALQAAKIHAQRGVDELLILDISATAENRGPDLKMVEELSAGCFIPITVGGGIRKLQDIRDLLNAGADKVAICTAAFEDPDFINRASDKYGAQAIVVCLDVKYGRIATHSGSWVLDTLPGPEGIALQAQSAQERGAGEILLSCVERDGTLQGYDLDLIREVSQTIDIPVIASGGCGSYEHMLQAFQAGADACAAGALFAFTDLVPKGAAEFLNANGINVRIP